MADYIAFLRGINVGGRNAVKMADLKKTFEDAGFASVRTIAVSGNVAFSSQSTDRQALTKKAEAALKQRIGRDIRAHVRSFEEIRKMLKTDPYRAFRIPKGAKRVVTFLNPSAKSALTLPYRQNDTHILLIKGSAAYSAYVPGPKAAKFMVTLEKAFGKSITTRTWDMLARLAK